MRPTKPDTITPEPFEEIDAMTRTPLKENLDYPSNNALDMP
jgi:hypothetical protein